MPRYTVTDTYTVTYTITAASLDDALAAGGDIDTYNDLDYAGTHALCGWWALCTETATTTIHHRILGDVPICDTCRIKAVHNTTTNP